MNTPPLLYLFGVFPGANHGKGTSGVRVVFIGPVEADGGRDGFQLYTIYGRS